MDRDGLRTQDTAELRRLLEERTADLQRVKAEYDNYRKRVARDRMAVRTVAAANVLRALLPVLDAVDRACAHEEMTPGLKEISDTLRDRTGALGLRAFGEVGDPFDPARHEAAAFHADPAATGMSCSKILRPGYRLGGELLRPAFVEVTGPPSEQNGSRGGESEQTPPAADDTGTDRTQEPDRADGGRSAARARPGAGRPRARERSGGGPADVRDRPGERPAAGQERPDGDREDLRDRPGEKPREDGSGPAVRDRSGAEPAGAQKRSGGRRTDAEDRPAGDGPVPQKRSGGRQPVRPGRNRPQQVIHGPWPDS
ncbi:nucleotide exchange factor GrpE [Streptomyces sp. SBST2-5]|uniref:Protein GrpE n=1 Tax=Streptomyces composti TaxID=2720025 RepID=A0ABX1A9C4_9ACTN|nr:nucleotide exchange factor GrpE [Streptomyces composti]NJP51810.1 nucleotide exchange factor GrpE [Streptomyces composti]